MSIYVPLEPGKFASHVKAGERLLMFQLLRWYDAVAALILAPITFFVVWPITKFAPEYLIWPVLVLIYVCAVVTLNKAVRILHFIHACVSMRSPLLHTLHLLVHYMNSVRRAKVLRRLPKVITEGYHTILLTVFIVGFMIAVRNAFEQFHVPLDEGSIWLLYILPIQQVARTGSIRLLAIVCALIVMADFVIHDLFGVALLFDARRILLLKALWLLLICLIPMLLIMYLADRESNLNTVRDLLRQLAGILTPLDKGLPNDIAAAIAKELGFAYVNVFLFASSPDQVGGELRIIGASNEKGQHLINAGFTLDQGKGIIGWAALHRQPCLVNDVARDNLKRYVKNDAFPGTRAELALPIMRGKVVLGVLDIQSLHAYAFSRGDVNLLDTLCTHLAVVLSAAQSLARVKGLYAVSQSAAGRFVSTQANSNILQEVVNAARFVLQADNVVMYCRNPYLGQLSDPISSGDIGFAPASAPEIDDNSDSIVHKVMASRSIQFFTAPTTTDNYSSKLDANLDESAFMTKAGIRSSIGIPIYVPDAGTTASVGAMFINYRVLRTRYTFTSEDLEWGEAVAELASLAVHNTMLVQTVIEDERKNLWQEIHDGLQQYTSFTRMLLEQTLDGRTIEDKLGHSDMQKLFLARSISQSLQQQVNYLLGVWRTTARDPNLFSALTEYANVVAKTLQVECTFTSSGTDNSVNAELKHDAEMMVRETVYNAHRHGRATRIAVSARAYGNALLLHITDNGTGFEPQSIGTRGGLATIQRRASRWTGCLRIRSTTKRGTRITIFLPIQSGSTASTHSALWTSLYQRLPQPVHQS